MTRTRAVLVTALALTTAAIPLVATSSAAAAPVAVLAWDFNGDGRADLAVGAPGRDIVTGSTKRVDAGAISVFLAAANGTYGVGTTLRQGKEGVPGAPEKGDQFGYAMTSGDYDGDGYADLAVSANREAVGSGAARKANAGMVIVLWGSASGLTGESKALTFNDSRVSGGAYVGDALASGDMNGDGKDELAVGSPGTEAVGVFRGANRSDFGTGGATVRFTEATANVPGTRHVGTSRKAGDLFGEALAMGDFDEDGLADLAVGAPYDYDARGHAVGAVTVFPGTGAGGLVDLGAGQVTRWSPYTAGVQGTGHTFTVKDLPDSFGRTLAAGDFDGDGADDLAIGIPGSPVKRGRTSYQDAGRVQILFGSAQGITSRDRLLSQDSTGIAGSSHKGDLFGASLAATSRPGGHDVLAVGSAKEFVWALPEGRAAGSKLITQNSTGVWGNKEKGDGFGSFVRFLDRLGDPNKQALAISAPGEDSGRGVVHVLPAGAAGLPTGTGSQRRLETDTGAARQAGDAWGWLGDSH